MPCAAVLFQYFFLFCIVLVVKLLLWNDCKLTATWRGFILFRFDTVFPTSQCYNATFLILFIAPFSFYFSFSCPGTALVDVLFSQFFFNSRNIFFITLLFLKVTLGFETFVFRNLLCKYMFGNIKNIIVFLCGIHAFFY